MKMRFHYLAICLCAVFVGSGLAAEKFSAGGQGGRQGDPHEQTDRPTLGPRTGPNIDDGPRTSTTLDIRKLLEIHTLYVENIDNSLSDKLIETLGTWQRIRLVTKPKEADATLRGTCLESRHLKHLHTEVFISDRNGKSIWQDIIYRPYNPPTLAQAVDDTAKLVLVHLQQTVTQGQR